MNYQQIFSISQQGMDIEKLRIDVVANNIANQHTIRSMNGHLFKPSQVTTQAVDFENYLQKTDSHPESIAHAEVTSQNLPPNKEYQPGHPNADQYGYVSYPGINQVDEMTTMLKASRAYEANIKMLNIARTMALQALSIGDEK